jgi:hypothetical protein
MTAEKIYTRLILHDEWMDEATVRLAIHEFNVPSCIAYVSNFKIMYRYQIRGKVVAIVVYPLMIHRYYLSLLLRLLLLLLVCF